VTTPITKNTQSIDAVEPLLKSDLDTDYFSDKEYSKRLTFKHFPIPTIFLSSLLSACGSDDDNSDPGDDPTDNDFFTSGPEDDIDAARFLQHASFSSQLDEIAEVRDIGYDEWITKQAELPINANAFANSSDDPSNVFGTFVELRYIWSEMIIAEDKLRLRMAYALSQIVVVSADNSGIDVWPGKSIAHYWDILKRHALGNYRDFLEEITLSIPMGAYLSMKGNQKADEETGRRPDENYAREIMELFSIGLVELNTDGTPVLDSSGEPIASYDQETVTQLARVFTGWDTDNTVGDDRVDRINIPMRHNPDKHSLEEKVFLGTTIPAGTLGPESLQIALDTIFAHPNVGPFIGRQLIQRFVTSNPSPDYVHRVATAFNDNGAGVRGDLLAVIRAVLLDDEAREKPDPSSISNGRVREPVLMQIQWLKLTDAVSHTGTFESQDEGFLFSQRPCRAPSVFNFYRPDYSTTRLAQKSQEQLGSTLYAPELQLFSESTIAQHANIFEDSITYGFRNHSLLEEGSDAIPTFETMTNILDLDELIDYVDLVFCAGNLSADTKTRLYDLVQSNYSDTDEELRKTRSELIALTLKLHPEYMVMK